MKKYIPNTITLLNLLFGCLGVFCAFHPLQEFTVPCVGALPGFMLCFYCVILSAVADFCDGLAARLLGAYSPLGAQLDSLSDLVSFGVAPCFLLWNMFTASSAPFWSSVVCLLIPMMGALRLARFNIDDSQTSEFLGLPIPASALFCIGLAAMFPAGVNLYAAVGSVVAIALLMVAPVRMYSLKFKSLSLRGNIMRYLLVIVAVICIGFWGWQGLYYLIGYYAITSFLKALFELR